MRAKTTVDKMKIKNFPLFSFFKDYLAAPGGLTYSILPWNAQPDCVPFGNKLAYDV
jgi:hypothetical protein